jgi:putrescine aminotransferase
MTTPELHQRAFGALERFELRASTFAGNALACRIALATLEIFEKEKLGSRSREMGARLVSGLRERLRDHPLVKQVRGRGLLVGVELGPTESGILNRVFPGLVEQVSRRVFGQWLAVRLLEEGIVVQPAAQQCNVLKLAPPLTVSADEVDRVVSAVSGILSEYRDLRRLMSDAGRRLGEQFMGGFALG